MNYSVTRVTRISAHMKKSPQNSTSQTRGNGSQDLPPTLPSQPSSTPTPATTSPPRQLLFAYQRVFCDCWKATTSVRSQIKKKVISQSSSPTLVLPNSNPQPKSIMGLKWENMKATWTSMFLQATSEMILRNTNSMMMNRPQG